ncbi:glutathione ABC transporter permease [Caldovatus sediminis]|jgi:peptide/nickel transport system permease protein|uniref:Glutathione ABC transporter permease n=1 Tax=Caldovatus sediminis TaxID=2041189 RepID=A0A8J2ZAC5_9PROT|nr:ABC transporter permease [Caldovatus sediminis]GGG28181.1 glutathione ABC transporter permease [Caldovatus sediminis]
MARFLLTRLGQALVTLALLTVLIFVLARLTGDPTPLVLPSEATEADRAFFRQQYGLDRPVHEQYVVFLRNVLRGDFGISFRYREPAFDLVLAAIGPTLQLAGVSMLVAILLGLPLGIAAALRPGSWLAATVRGYASLGQAMPTFWTGLMLIFVFAISIPVLPSSGYGTAANFVLPAVTLGFYASASVTMLTWANMTEALRSDFVQMERVLGIPRRLIVLKHALRNASLPIVTYLGLQFGLLLGGAVVTERVFAWPGVGQMLVDAILNRDYPVVQAAVMLTAVLVMTINLVVDLLYAVLDPRVSRS